MIRFTKLLTLSSVSFLALVVVDVPAAGQAMVEYGLAAGAASTSTAPAKGLKDSIGGVFSTLDKTLKPAPSQTESNAQSTEVIRTSTALTPEQRTQAKTAHPQEVLRQPRPNYENPAAIQAGIDYEDLVRRFGPPALQFTDGPSSKTMSYLGKNGTIQVWLQGGKVMSAKQP